MHITRISFVHTWDIVHTQIGDLASVDSDAAWVNLSPTLGRWAATVYFSFFNIGYRAVIGLGLAGFVYLQKRRAATHVNWLGTSRAFRRQGVGRALLTFAEERAAEWCRPRMSLEVATANLPALSLYEKLGYRRTDDRCVIESLGFRANRPDHILMLKWLTAAGPPDSAK